MKTITKILVALGVTLFLLTVGMKSEAEAQCDSTWTQKKDTLTIFGCEYEVELCIQCTYAYPGKVQVNSVKKLDDSCFSALTPDQVLAQVVSQASNWATVYFETCILSGPPCDLNDPEIVTYRYPRCWLMLKDVIADQTWYVHCSDQFCEVEYEYCVDYPGMNVRLNQIGYNPIGGTPSCTLEGYQVTPPTQHMIPSDCFILHTPCD